ncbi:PREDICTED: killer cell lectin-like receptor subfamily B member 1B allele B-like [Elephantulus edwardii]|uniref:killer cell lectin-like receptor subfamily B member 1B allele B-like n=1 Tax=Elephantulus edwardii TaxID=28737 RepID=UPI0003F07E21|nr:PREDICTED: killer cell lectin-like receptor subfamily B member 1B allele B-like [Elephantulus edwardii]
MRSKPTATILYHIYSKELMIYFTFSDVCQGPHWHHFAIKIGCAVIILFVLAVIGMSVAGSLLNKNLSVEKNSVNVQENKSIQGRKYETTETLCQLKCSMPWYSTQEKCLFLSPTSRFWNDSLADCYSKESSLLLIQDMKELRLIQGLVKKEAGIMYWIGLNFTLPQKTWKWINGTPLNSTEFKIYGSEDKTSCALISGEKLVSETCDSENRWICQKTCQE